MRCSIVSSGSNGPRILRSIRKSVCWSNSGPGYVRKTHDSNVTNSLASKPAAMTSSRWEESDWWYNRTNWLKMSQSGGKQGKHRVLTTRKSSMMSIRITSKWRTSHILWSLRSSNWLPSIRSLTASPRTSIARAFHFFGRAGGRNPLCFWRWMA